MRNGFQHLQVQTQTLKRGNQKREGREEGKKRGGQQKMKGAEGGGKEEREDGEGEVLEHIMLCHHVSSFVSRI